MSWGEIYNTSWWGVALDTARTVKARPDFFGSQLNLLTSEQPNLVVNGDFSDGLNGWTVHVGSPVVLDGEVHITGDLLRQDIVEIGKTYKVSVNVTEVNNGLGKVQLGNSTYVFSGNVELQTFTLKAESNNIFYIGRQNSDDDFKIDNVSVQVARADLDQIEAKKCLADWIHTTALKDLNN